MSHPDLVRSLSHDHHTIDITTLQSTATASHLTGDSSPPPGPSIVPLIGLGPSTLHSSYFTLYRPLTTVRDKCILAAAVILALAAGVPLPLIGLIFGKIINDFPPSEGEMRVRVAQLLCVAVAYFCITWGWATAWGVVGERVSRGLREALLRKAVGMDVGWFDVECPDVGCAPLPQETVWLADSIRLRTVSLRIRRQSSSARLRRWGCSYSRLRTLSRRSLPASSSMPA